MRLLLLILFVVVEALIIGRLTDAWGAGPVFLWLFGTAMAGVLLIRRQGLVTLRSVQLAQARGELPAFDLLESLLRFVGAVLLIVPGLISDVLGLLLLWRGARRRLARGVAAGMRRRRRDPDAPVTIEGEFRDRPDDRLQ